MIDDYQNPYEENGSPRQRHWESRPAPTAFAIIGFSFFLAVTMLMTWMVLDHYDKMQEAPITLRASEELTKGR